MGHLLSCPIPCSSWVSRRKLPWAVFRQLLDVFKAATTTPGKPVAVFSHAKASFFMFRQKFLFQFVPILFCPVTGLCWEENGSTIFSLPSDNKTSPEPLLNNPSSFSLSSDMRCSCPFIMTVAFCRTLSSNSRVFINWGGQPWAQDSRLSLTTAKQEDVLLITTFGALFSQFSIHSEVHLISSLWGCGGRQKHC